MMISRPRFRVKYEPMRYKSDISIYIYIYI